MRIGFTFPYDADRDGAAEILRRGEAAGLSSVWIYENLYGPGAFACAGFAAAVLQTAAIGIGTTSPYARTPGALAMEAATLNDLTGGRFTLGLAASNPALIAGMGGVAGQPLAAVAETLQIVRGASSGGVERLRGARYSVEDLRLMWEPRSGPPGLLVGTLKPKMMAVAAAWADGILISSHAPLPVIRRVAQEFRELWLDAGRSGEPRIVVYVPFSFADTEDEAIDQLRPRMASAIARLAVDPTIGELLEAGGAIGPADARQLADQLVADPSRVDLVPAEVIQAHAIAATSGTCEDRLRAYLEAGATELVLFEISRLAGVHDAFQHLATLGLER